MVTILSVPIVMEINRLSKFMLHLVAKMLAHCFVKVMYVCNREKFAVMVCLIQGFTYF